MLDFPSATDPAALVIGPTGLGLASNCDRGEDACNSGFGGREPVLYVADSLDNRVDIITNPLSRTQPAGPGKVLSSGGSLNDPLGLTVAPNGHILVVNGNDGFITEITSEGKQIAHKLLDTNGTPPGAGALFGLIFDTENGLVFVDDATNTLDLLH